MNGNSNNNDNYLLNFNNLLLRSINNPLNNEACLNFDTNLLYSNLLNLINSGNLSPDIVSQLMNNLNEFIKNNFDKSNNISDLISINQENHDFRDQQGNLLEISKIIYF